MYCIPYFKESGLETFNNIAIIQKYYIDINILHSTFSCHQKILYQISDYCQNIKMRTNSVRM